MSPGPWNDARARLLAAGFGVPIEWPNEPFQAPDAAPWLSIETVGDVDMPIEIGGGGWMEEGRLFVHVLVPAFSGSDMARALAKQVANTFRGIGPNNTVYTGASIGAGERADEQGTLWRITVLLDWRYQDVSH